MGDIADWQDHADKIMDAAGCGPCPEDPRLRVKVYSQFGRSQRE